MKNKKLIIGVALACAVAGTAAVVGANKSSAAGTRAAVGETLVLWSGNNDSCPKCGNCSLYPNCPDYTNLPNCSFSCLNWTDTITGSYSSNVYQNIGGGYWCGTYSSIEWFTVGDFKLEHDGYCDWNYWGGFTTGSNGDSRNFGYYSNPDTMGSVNWIPNQWGVMAGGGISSITTGINGCDLAVAKKGLPYFISFGSGQEIWLKDSSTFLPLEIWICNHPWPYWGNFKGDGFARPLNKPGDYFVLKIEGFIGDNLTGTIVDTLAVYDKRKPTLVSQNPNWHKIDFSTIGFSRFTQKLVFTLASSDNDPVYGMNTAAYFNMDKLKVEKTGAAPTTPAVARKRETPKAVEVKDYFPIASYTGGAVVVYDANGKEALRTTVKAGEKVNLSKLPKGEYRLQHGHRSIPITKK